MTKQQINTAFVFLLGVSAFLLARLHQAQYHLILLSGIAPLTIYFFLLKANSKNISRSQIDNIYYFGFLITIISLAVSAFHFNPESGMKLDLITKQFSVGLVATGLALMFKLVLQEGYTDPEEENLIQKNREEIQKFTDEAAKMFMHLQMASENLTKLANTSLSSVNSNYETSVEDLKHLHAKSLKVISESIEEAIGDQFQKLKTNGDQAAAVLKEFSDQVNTVSASTSFKKLSTSVSKLESSFSDFSSNVDGALSKINDSTEKVVRHHTQMEDLIQASISATTSLLAFRKKIEEDNSIAEKTKVMFDRKMAEASKDAIKSFQTLSNSIDSLSSKIENSKSFESKVS